MTARLLAALACLATLAPATPPHAAQAQRTTSTTSAGVCHTLDIRNDASGLSKLANCTVIEGTLSIVLMERVKRNSFEPYSFPQLREITDYLIIYRVKGLTSIGQLFPNLAVIRGNTLFKNFALVIYDMEDLKSVGLKSLTYIQRGSVRIEKNDNLCFANTIDWSAIAPPSTLHKINYNGDPKACGPCPDKDSVGNQQCHRDPNGETFCWDVDTCQKMCPSKCRDACMDSGKCCDGSCLGGCSGPSAHDCFVCRHLSFGVGEQRVCLDKCPPAAPYEYLNRRCVTAQECREMPPPVGLSKYESQARNKTYKPVNGQCLYNCPIGFNEENGTCVPCKSVTGAPNSCIKNCVGATIESLADAELLVGCTHIMADLEIKISGGANVMQDLGRSLGEVREIYGSLRVHRSFSLITLSFLKNLVVIHGNNVKPLNKNAALYIFDNSNLEELWDWGSRPPLKILNGKLFIHSNPKLCFDKILPLLNMTKTPQKTFDEHEVSELNNGDRAMCSSMSLNLTIQKTESTTAQLLWYPYCLSDPRQLLGYWIYYTEAPHNVTQYDKREACQDEWKVMESTAGVLQSSKGSIAAYSREGRCSNLQPVFKVLANLKAYTRYATYVKTLTIGPNIKGAQSPIVYFTTMPGAPSSPMFTGQDPVSPNETVLKWMRPAMPNGEMERYHLNLELQTRAADKTGQDVCTRLPKLSQSGRDEDDKPKKKVEKEDGKGSCPVEVECSCASNQTSFSEDKQKELQDTTDFENYLQNLIYVKSSNRTGSRLRRAVAEPVPASSKPSNSEDVPITLNDSFSENGYVVNKTYVLAGDVTELRLDRLRHGTSYRATLWACRRRVPSESPYTAACSKKHRIFFVTRNLESADMVTDVRADILHGNKSTPEVRIRWREPLVPNGYINAFHIRHTRVENELTNATGSFIHCVTADEFVKSGKSYLLRDLAPGNYSITVTTYTTTSIGPPSKLTYVYIPDRTIEIAQKWLWGVVVGCIAVVAGLVGGVWYVRRGLLPGADNNKLFASVNPEYVSTVYVPDEWEVPRANIELGRELGQGSFGMVYEGTAKNIVKGQAETKCAVKTVNEHATERERIEFLNEASVMKAFDTHHVVRLLGVVSSGQPALVVMELMEHGDLKSYLRSMRPDGDNSLPGPAPAPAPASAAGAAPQRKPPTLQRIQQMAAEIADGMAYLSAKKFVHRDLAARNCMVAGDLTVKIGDFGMTRDIYETDYYRKGTKGLLPVRWMSPESLKDGVFSSNSDVWSFGVVLWEMATLAMQPYQGLSNEQVLRYVVEGGVMERPERCPDRLYELMRACWSHRPSDRPSFLQLVAALAPIAHQQFRHRSFFHTPRGQELYAVQQAQVEEAEATGMGVNAVAGGLFGVSGRLASWVREVSASLRSTSPRGNEDAVEPLHPSSSQERRALVMKAVPSPNGVVNNDKYNPVTSNC